MRRIAIILSILFMSQCLGLELVRQKNVATIISFPIVDGNNLAIVSAAGLDSEIDTSSDSVAPDGFTDCTNEATETDAGVSGWYYLSLTQAEMNFDYIDIKVFSSTTATVDQRLKIRTMVGDPLLKATTDDGGTINVTAGAVDTVTTTTAATDVSNDVGITQAGADKVWGTAARTLTANTNLNDPTAAAIVNEWETQSQADPTGFHVNLLEVEGTDATDYIESRTLATSAYFLFGSDDVAVVTLTSTASTVTDGATSAELAKVPKSDSNVSWNATALAAIEGEVDDGLVAQKLDHLVAVADADDPVNDSIVAKLFASDGDWSGADKTTDAQEAIRDRGDAAWTTGAGGSSPTVEEIRAEIDANSVQLAAIVEDTGELQTNQGNWLTATGFATPTNITAGTITTVTNLTNAATSGDLTATMKASVNTEVDTGLSDYDGPTNAEMVARTLLSADYFLFGSDDVNNVTTVDATTTNTDMVGTDNAALAATALTDATWTDARAAYLDELAAANLPTDIADIPTVAEFEARTILAASYFDSSSDQVITGSMVASALDDMFSLDSGNTYAGAVSGSVVKEIVDNAGGSGLTVGAIADGVWDELLAGHAVVGSAGEALSAAGTAGDPWITPLPGAYGAGTAGYIIGTNLDAKVSQAGAGSGSVIVSDVYKGGDFTYKTAEGAGIDNAVVRAYLTADFETGGTGSAFIKASTTTTTDGGWSDFLNLDPETYTLYYFKQGLFGPDTTEVTVTD